MTISETDYGALYAAASGSADYWVQAQEYKRELQQVKGREGVLILALLCTGAGFIAIATVELFRLLDRFGVTQ